jgi:hypothetical protein
MKFLTILPWTVLPLLRAVVVATIVLSASGIRSEEPAIDPLFPSLPSAIMKRVFPTTAAFVPNKSTVESRSEALQLTLRSKVPPASFTVRKGHGLRQFNKMIDDRPHMGQYLAMPSRRLDIVTEDDTIAAWAIEHFEGKHTRQPIYWKPDFHAANTPLSEQGYPSYWRGGCAGDPLCVTIKDADDPSLPNFSSFELAWSYLFFELLNAQNLPDFNDLQMRVFSRTPVTREVYIKECAKLEWSVLQKLDKVRKEVWIPWCISRGVPHDSAAWRLSHAEDFEAWYASFTDPKDYPFSIFGFHYDAMRQWEEQNHQWVKAKNNRAEPVDYVVPLLQAQPFAPNPTKDQ